MVILCIGFLTVIIFNSPNANECRAVAMIDYKMENPVCGGSVFTCKCHDKICTENSCKNGLEIEFGIKSDSVLYQD